MVATTPPSKPYIPWTQRLELPTLLPGAIFALVMVWSVVQSIASSNWADGLNILVAVALPALLVGIVFARMEWLPSWLAHFLSAVLGIAWSVQSVGPLLLNEIRLELGPGLAERLGSWSDKASEILIRVVLLFRTIQAGGRGEDIVLFITALALLMWALGYVTSWMLFRAHWAWPAVILNAVVILVNYTFASPKPNTLFFIFLIASLLLVVHQHISQQQRRWASALIDYPEWMTARFLTAAALAIGTAALVTSLLPGNVSSAQVARTWRVVSSPFTAMRESWETAFSTINAPAGSGSGFFTRSMRVGGGRSLGNALVMRVHSSVYDYWRAITRDRYTGRSWENTVGERARADLGTSTVESARTELPAGMVAASPDDIQGRTLVTQTIELAQDRSDNLLTTGGQFFAAGVPVLIEHSFLGSGAQLQPNFSDTAAVFAETPLHASDVYTVTALISTADVAGLQAASQDYPGWISQQYLQLPDELPQRVRDQAHQLVTDANATNPYNKAVAIQAYLRSFTYDESRPAPPADRDWADYFIFDSKRGYCDDFATAMIVMLRAEGVPARLAQGYAGGTIDPQTGAYAVTESIAHSWPEAYFPGYGWQRFEPTPASYANVPVRPQTASATDGASGLPSDFQIPDYARDRDLSELDEIQRGATGSNATAILEAQRQAEAQQRLMIVAAILVVLGGALGYAYFLLNRNLRGLSPAAAAYARMTRLANWSGIRHEEHQTPYEYGGEISSNLPLERDTVSTIVDGYVREQYQGSKPNATVDYDKQWQSLRRPLLGHMLGQLFARRPSLPKRRQ